MKKISNSEVDVKKKALFIKKKRVEYFLQNCNL